MEASPDTLLFEAVIVPHRSLSSRGVKAVAAALVGLSAVVTTAALLLGAWPVVGFAGAEIGLAVALLRFHSRPGAKAELLLLSDRELKVVRIDRGGRRCERVFSPDWFQVVLKERIGRVPALLLGSRGQMVEVAAELNEVKKRDLAAALSLALDRRRHPLFDNPQLRQ